MSLRAYVVSLFIVLNVIGNIPIFLALLARYDHKHQRRIIFREMVIAFFILLGFGYGGEKILTLMGISRPIIGIAGGILLFIIALTMVFPKPTSESDTRPMQEPFVFPLATPIIAGPGSISFVMSNSYALASPAFISLGIFIAWLPSLIIVFFSSTLKRFLREKGLIACERVGGMLITLIAVQMIISGIISLVKDSFF